MLEGRSSLPGSAPLPRAVTAYAALLFITCCGRCRFLSKHSQRGSAVSIQITGGLVYCSWWFASCRPRVFRLFLAPNSKPFSLRCCRSFQRLPIASGRPVSRLLLFVIDLSLTMPYCPYACDRSGAFRRHNCGPTARIALRLVCLATPVPD